MSYDEMKLIMGEIQLLGLFIVAAEDYKAGLMEKDSYERTRNAYKEYLTEAIQNSIKRSYGDFYEQTQHIIKE